MAFPVVIREKITEQMETGLIATLASFSSFKFLALRRENSVENNEIFAQKQEEYSESKVSEEIKGKYIKKGQIKKFEGEKNVPINQLVQSRGRTLMDIFIVLASGTSLWSRKISMDKFTSFNFFV